VKVTWVLCVFCLHDTRGQYLALSDGFTCFSINLEVAEL